MRVAQHVVSGWQGVRRVLWGKSGTPRSLSCGLDGHKRPVHASGCRSYVLILLLLLFAIIYVTVISKRGKQEPWMVSIGQVGRWGVIARGAAWVKRGGEDSRRSGGQNIAVLRLLFRTGCPRPMLPQMTLWQVLLVVLPIYLVL